MSSTCSGPYILLLNSLRFGCCLLVQIILNVTRAASGVLYGGLRPLNEQVVRASPQDGIWALQKGNGSSALQRDPNFAYVGLPRFETLPSGRHLHPSADCVKFESRSSQRSHDSSNEAFEECRKRMDVEMRKW